MSAENSISTSHPASGSDVVVTGVGIISSLGNGWRANADGFREGRVALRGVSLFDTSQQRVHAAGEVEMPAELPENELSKKDRSRIERGSELLIHATAEALKSAAIGFGARLPMVLGTSAGAMAHGEAFYR